MDGFINPPKSKKQMRGALAQYTNSELSNMEEGARERATVERI